MDMDFSFCNFRFLRVAFLAARLSQYKNEIKHEIMKNTGRIKTGAIALKQVVISTCCGVPMYI